MNVPALVASALGDEDVAAHVPLKGEDALFVTPTRTIRYQADGLLSDESIEELTHNAERIEVSEGRRKSKIVLDYGLEGRESFTVPGNKLDDALHPVLAGVLNAADVTEPGETVKRTYRFSELTLVVTSDRVVKHIGGAVWDPEYEEIAFDDVTGIDTEEGNVASQLVLETSGRTERIKAPNEQFRDVRETIENALFAYHDVGSRAEFERVVAPKAEESEPAADNVTFDSDVRPIETSTADADAETESQPEAGQSQSETGQPQSETGQPQSETGQPQSETGQPTGDTSNQQSERAIEQTSQAIQQTNAEGGNSEQTSAAERSSPDQAASGGQDELTASGFEAATATMEPEVDRDELEAELDAMQEVLDAQRELLEQQQARLDAVRDLIPDR